MSSPKVLALVLAGGEGSRLYPLTAQRSKPAVPFGGGYRIIDFVLSNLVNSHILSIYVLVQYKSQSLIEHLHLNWRLKTLMPDQFITEVPPQQQMGMKWFRGTADAVYQNLHLIRQHQPDYVAVLSSDHVYRMDLGQMLDSHREREADISVATLPVPLSRASCFGVVDVTAGGRITGFQEKPPLPRSLPDRPGSALASMGIYLFSTEVLETMLEQAQRQGLRDFGGDILPRLVSSQRLYAYDFTDNRIPGLKPNEIPAYWHDVGTIETYWEAHRDLLGTEPRFDLFNPHWPIRCYHNNGPAVRLLGQRVDNCLVGSGTTSRAALMTGCILGQNVVVDEGARLEDCIIMDHVHIGRNSRLRHTIVDRYNRIEPDSVIGWNPEIDRQHYHLDPSGLVIVPRGVKNPPAERGRRRESWPHPAPPYRRSTPASRTGYPGAGGV